MTRPFSGRPPFGLAGKKHLGRSHFGLAGKKHLGRPPFGLAGKKHLGRLLLAASCATVLLGLAGCSANDSASRSSPAVGPAQPDGAKNAAGGTAVDAAPNAANPGGQQSPQLAPQQRSIIYTGSMTVTVRDVAKGADSAGAVAVTAGGNVGADSRTLDGDQSEAQLTLRIPSDQFQSTLDKLAKLGTEVTRSISTQDVTNDLIDIDARLTTQRASVERVRALLSKANTIGDVVSIESELTKREADLDSLEQRQTSLAGQVALSTITLSLRAVGAPVPPPIQSDSGFLSGLKSGWQAFLNSAKVFLTVVGWLLPWLIVVGVPAWLIIRYTRRRQRAIEAARPPLPTPMPTPVPATLPAAPSVNPDGN
jgi:Domain of unknown function (DUF4349)